MKQSRAERRMPRSVYKLGLGCAKAQIQFIVAPGYKGRGKACHFIKSDISSSQALVRLARSVRLAT